MKTIVRAFRGLDITEAKALDPIHVIFDDIDKGRGRLTVECFGSAWSAYWGGMGERTVHEFVAAADAEYLCGCLVNARYPVKKLEEKYVLRIAAAVIEACREMSSG